MIRLSFVKPLLLLLCLLIGLQGNAFAKHLKSKSNHGSHTSQTQQIHQTHSSWHKQDISHRAQIEHAQASKDCVGAGKCLLNAQPVVGTEVSVLSLAVSTHLAPKQSRHSYSSVLHSPPKPPPKA